MQRVPNQLQYLKNGSLIESFKFLNGFEEQKKSRRKNYRNNKADYNLITSNYYFQQNNNFKILSQLFLQKQLQINKIRTIKIFIKRFLSYKYLRIMIHSKLFLFKTITNPIEKNNKLLKKLYNKYYFNVFKFMVDQKFWKDLKIDWLLFINSKLSLFFFKKLIEKII